MLLDPSLVGMENLSRLNQIKNVMVLVLVLTQLKIAPGGFSAGDLASSIQEASTREFIPLKSTPTEYRMFESEKNTSGRRSLAPFQLCLLCKCCAAGRDPTTCTNMPCCFGIDCQLPNKPFGVCAFVPKTCNCTACATST